MKTMTILVLLLSVVIPTNAETLSLTSPTGGETWMTGTTREITWISSEVVGTVGIELLKRKSDGTTVCFAKADQIPVSKGAWSWEIPHEMPQTSFFAKITLDSVGNPEDSGGDFFIIANPDKRLDIRAPAGGETWARGTQHDVAWDYGNVEGMMVLSIAKAGVPVLTIPDIPVAEGRYALTIPEDFPDGTDYRITLRGTGCSAVSEAFQIGVGPTGKKWTFMKYIDADNNLEECELNTFLDLASIGSNDDVNVVVQLDRHPAYDHRFGDWTGTRRYLVTKGMEPTTTESIQDLGEVNMADSSTLTNFLCWAMDQYPADRYILVFSNHGLGWEDDSGAYDNWKLQTGRAGGGLDSTNGCLYLSNQAIQKGIEGAPEKLAVVGFDACDMDMIEVLYQLRNTGAGIFIGSQNTEDYWGWDYVRILSSLQARPTDISDRELASIICNTFMENNRNYTPFYPSTQAAVDLAEIEPLAMQISQLADAMRLVPEKKRNVKSLAAQVVHTARSAVICERHSPEMDGKIYGMNIYFPKQRLDPKYQDDVLDFVRDTNWKSFLEAFLESGLKSTWIGKARHGLWEEYEQDEPGSDYGHIDITGFCLNLSRTSWPVRIQVAASPEDIAEISPAGAVYLAAGNSINLETRLKEPGNGYHFVRWQKSGDGIVDDPYNMKTRMTVQHDGTVTAIYAKSEEICNVVLASSQNGSLNGTTTQQIPSGGAMNPVTAVPDDGYVFLGWNGDYEGTDNPLRVGMVSANMKIFAIFGKPPAMDIRSVSLHLGSTEKKNRIRIRNATYPQTAERAIVSAEVRIDDAVIFECPAGPGWSNQNQIFSFHNSDSSCRLIIDTNHGYWFFSATAFSGASAINPADGISIGLVVNGKQVGQTDFPAEKLYMDSAISGPFPQATQ